ncbi:hypothetical protein J5T34_03620 [Cupriavidus gilardii]|uniref:gp53-like domain-containing protein n=1 Tax=Cupriavidus gilardii TaxID=82541 RepID=UPI001ABEA3D3|nr:hypothetical protein [Cupriavidus gilardii]MBO4119827.1 hypothetical protein [Cupriavidus gilardii]
MAAMDFFTQFETLWAQTGQVEAIEDNQYKAGWAYIGATPPSVEQFNKVQQLSDQKAAWLFAQIKELAEQGGFELTADMVDALTKGIATSMQSGSGVIGIDTGAANAYVVNYTPAVAELKDGMALWFKVKTANTGVSTLNVNGLGARPIIGMAHTPLQGGEMVASGKALMVWKAESNSWVLVGCSGGAQQVAVGTQSGHAIQLGQFTGTNQSLGASGYQKLPGGLILQWGGVSAANGLGNVTFPIAFPTALVGVFIGETSGAGNPNVWGIRSQTRTGFIGVVCDLAGTAIADGSYYCALGY